MIEVDYCISSYGNHNLGGLTVIATYSLTAPEDKFQNLFYCTEISVYRQGPPCRAFRVESSSPGGCRHSLVYGHITTIYLYGHIISSYSSDHVKSSTASLLQGCK